MADVTISGSPGPDADLNCWMTWYELPVSRKTRLDVGHFTHLAGNYGFDTDKALGRFDHLVATTEHGKKVLVGQGIPEGHITVIYHGNDGFVPKKERVIDIPGKILVGISGRIYANGRKREWLPVELSWHANLDRFAFIFLGRGWENIVTGLAHQGISARHLKDVPYEKYPDVFASLDAYLCTAYAEGGPIGAIQAMGCGVPVISPNYGFAHDFGALYYKTVGELAQIFNKFEPRLGDPIRTSWQDWVARQWELFERLWA